MFQQQFYIQYEIVEIVFSFFHVLSFILSHSVSSIIASDCNIVQCTCRWLNVSSDFTSDASSEQDESYKMKNKNRPNGFPSFEFSIVPIGSNKIANESPNASLDWWPAVRASVVEPYGNGWLERIAKWKMDEHKFRVHAGSEKPKPDIDVRSHFHHPPNSPACGPTEIQFQTKTNNHVCISHDPRSVPNANI